MNATPFEIDEPLGDGEVPVSRVLIGLGSNLGDRQEWLRQALGHLRQTPRMRLVGCSSLYETRPEGPIADQPDFLNACALFETTLEPSLAFRELLHTEALLGRQRDLPGGPRNIDLDLLVYEDFVSEDPFLSVPHPRMHERGFVLLPAVEVAAEMLHPVFEVPLHALLERISPVTGVVQRRKAGAWLR